MTSKQQTEQALITDEVTRMVSDEYRALIERTLTYIEDGIKQGHDPLQMVAQARLLVQTIHKIVDAG